MFKTVSNSENSGAMHVECILLTQFEHGIHGLNEPEVVWSKPLCQLCYLGDQVGADVLVPRLAEVADQLLRNDHHIHRVGHLVQQVQCLLHNNKHYLITV